VPVEGFDPETLEEGGAGSGVAPEAEQVFETEPQVCRAGQGAWVGDADHLVPERVHGVEAERLVAGRVGEDVGVSPIGGADAVVHAVEEQALDYAAG
jgi:hypothetical protein